MVAGSEKRWTAFAQNTQASIAMMFGLFFMVFAFAAGMALDYSRATHMQAQVAAAIDAAALAGGRALIDGRLTDDEVKNTTKDYFTTYLANQGGFGTVSTPVVTVDRAAGTVNIDVNVNVPMTFTKIAGFTDMDIPVSTMSKFDQRDVELGMALDVTGSMWGSKISDLRNAANDLIDILLPDGGTPNSIRIGLAPYATSVNAGSFATNVTGVAGASCVFERGGTNAFTDAEPVGSNVLGQSPSAWCPSAVVQPITNNKSSLKTAISTYNANGWTAGHLGLAWAWYLVSPNWASIWPSGSDPVAYGQTETIKAVVLMTDGEFNTWYVGGNGNSSSQASSLCTEMKNKGIIVYSVAFSAGSSAQSLLQGCASSSNTYFNATNGNELRAAFQKIALNINKLRLTN